MVRTKGSFKRPFLEVLVWSCEAVVAVYLLYLGVQLVQAVPYTQKKYLLKELFSKNSFWVLLFLLESEF